TVWATTEFAEAELQFDFRRNGENHCDLLVGDSESLISSALNGGWFHVTAKITPNEIRGRTQGPGVGRETMRSRVRTRNRLGFRAKAGATISLRNVKLLPVGHQSLFNGKDLSGWKEFPGRKSKFTVTPEGWLNIKNGPGDLQTEGRWADFVLQLEC